MEDESVRPWGYYEILLDEEYCNMFNVQLKNVLNEIQKGYTKKHYQMKLNFLQELVLCTNPQQPLI